MNTYNLGFIADKDIYNHVKNTVEKYRFDISLSTFNKNLIDPIKMTFDSKIYSKSIEDTIESEIIRQIDKTNTNEIGYFHQNLFKYIDSAWTVPTHGYDVVNEKLHFYVEMKNKHNTMNSSSSQKTYMRMMSKVAKDKQATCALVEVIAKKSQNEIWKVSLDSETVSDERIRKISIDKFYEIVTSQKDSFKNLCEKLPIILDDVIHSMKDRNKTNTVFSELKAISPNLLKSIYLLSFSKYEGFNKFDI
ncbi:Eco47II family restriction endonuclease [Candidatus Shapirobacteria bacterium]|nr:Eco47II family restriction endonuclease [Candidatus Shapirobacteria bacterium]